ncbi:hypothetical protein AB6N01_01155 [Alcaligenes nematophilus]|uniref:hypothetical protein n=1 Tax=Alcaligenes nematophilus TaxID=2994643 RepID=UPI0034E05ABA
MTNKFLTANGQVELARYPELRALCWARPGATTLTPVEAFDMYTKLWAYVYPKLFGDEEKQLLAYLTEAIGNGLFEPHQIPTWQMKNRAHEIAKDLSIAPPPSDSTHKDLLAWLTCWEPAHNIFERLSSEKIGHLKAGDR